ncbi:MAG TPA: carbon-nitrogen hydrolase family protein [Kofleriaceae bacterium]|nr:carbon-nitrogen hydrolase family protein [Kofleriaceae bacterium]
MSRVRFTAAAAQMTATADLAANLEVCRERAAEAAGAGVALLVLPENFAFLGMHERDKLATAEVLELGAPGPVLSMLLEVARTHQMWVVGGGMAEVIPGDPDRTYNTLIVVSPAGQIVARYRKLHLFDVDIPGKATLRESSNTAAGDDVIVAETGVGRLGASICYDLRFPELYRRLAVDEAADILLVPAAFTKHTGTYHWHTLLRARAIENQCYVIAAAQTGRHNDKRESYGHSLIIDPWGEVIAELPDGPGLATAEIDLARADDVRARMPCRDHLRLR